ncbi:MAG: pyridoxamine 5'-phosphate oxidase [Chitinophagaceae bacterium]|nr:pyridoxamine 5'-phosphate oxidase [Chitinophagaceae bacterium]
MNSISSLRKDYKLHALTETDVKSDPFRQFSTWWDEAVDSQIEEVNAMTLATCSTDGVPSARIVLLKGFNENGFVFFTNYNSYKGKDLLENPRACLVFFWKELERQVRITGLVQKVSPEESDEYFNSRPLGSKLGAWSSPQSEVISNREWLEENAKTITSKLGDSTIARPPHWGGYRVRPVTVEFWQGRPNRLHDRIMYSLEGEQWLIRRLAP